MTNAATHNFTLAIDSSTDDHLALALMAVPKEIDIKGRFVMLDDACLDIVTCVAFSGTPYHQIMDDKDRFYRDVIDEFLEDIEADALDAMLPNIQDHFDFIHQNVLDNLPENYFEKLQPLCEVMDNLINTADADEANAQVAGALKELNILYLGMDN